MAVAVVAQERRSEWQPDTTTLISGGLSQWSDQELQMSLPTGFGDVLIQSIHADYSQIATYGATAEGTVVGIAAFVVDPAGGIQSFVGTAPFYETIFVGDRRANATIVPEMGILWKQNEVLTVYVPDLDSNASATGDVMVYVRVRRLRNIRPGTAPRSRVQLTS